MVVKVFRPDTVYVFVPALTLPSAIAVITDTLNKIIQKKGVKALVFEYCYCSSHDLNYSEDIS